MQDRFGADAKSIYGRVLSFFRLLTLATIVRGSLLLVHGGLPAEEPDIGSIASAHESHVRNRVMEELLWNDPRLVEGEPEWEPSRRGVGRHFGPSVTARWLDATNTKAVVRGHEPCRGYRIDHGGKVLTLFSCKESYPEALAAFLLAGRDELAAIKDAKDLARYVKL
jgi:protein phosphatase